MCGFEPNTPLQAIAAALHAAHGDIKHVKATANVLDGMAADMLQAQDAMLVAQQQPAVQANKHRRGAQCSGACQCLLLVIVSLVALNHPRLLWGRWLRQWSKDRGAGTTDASHVRGTERARWMNRLRGVAVAAAGLSSVSGLPGWASAAVYSAVEEFQQWA